jgi:putative transposase
VETNGLMVDVGVHPATITDRHDATLLRSPLKDGCPCVTRIRAQHGDAGTLEGWVTATLNGTLDIATPPGEGVRAVRVPPGVVGTPEIPRGSVVVTRRRVGERAFGWLGRSRRVSKDTEHLSAREERWISMAMLRLLLARFARQRDS